MTSRKTKSRQTSNEFTSKHCTRRLVQKSREISWRLKRSREISYIDYEFHETPKCVKDERGLLVRPIVWWARYAFIEQLFCATTDDAHMWLPFKQQVKCVSNKSSSVSLQTGPSDLYSNGCMRAYSHQGGYLHRSPLAATFTATPNAQDCRNLRTLCRLLWTFVVHIIAIFYFGGDKILPHRNRPVEVLRGWLKFHACFVSSAHQYSPYPIEPDNQIF